MDTDRTAGRAAQPAEEEIKKHGDVLKKQVADAAGQQQKGMPGEGQESKEARDDDNWQPP
ncbi:MAG TPA: hypothetical protein VEC35_11365 [Noviherbaspirillum sp.]|nr:hypothetical protein [Noviherbaspirillum sp.]